MQNSYFRIVSHLRIYFFRIVTGSVRRIFSSELFPFCRILFFFKIPPIAVYFLTNYFSLGEKQKTIKVDLLISSISTGTLYPDGSRQDVDREHVLYFDAIDEGQSWLVQENLERCHNPAECLHLFESEDEEFVVFLLGLFF